MNKSVSVLCGCDRPGECSEQQEIKGKDDLRTEMFDSNKGFESWASIVAKSIFSESDREYSWNIILLLRMELEEELED